jgi:hypothetical protein
MFRTNSRHWAMLGQSSEGNMAMRKDEAMQHGLGYAAGREDASGAKTADPTGDSVGFMRFGEAYASGWDDFNGEKRSYMTNARDAYETWQATRGQTIFRDEITPQAEREP